MNLQVEQLPEGDQFKLKVLQAKARFLELMPGVNKHHAPYAPFIRSFNPDISPERIYRVMKLERVDTEVLEAFEGAISRIVSE